MVEKLIGPLVMFGQWIYKTVTSEEGRKRQAERKKRRKERRESRDVRLPTTNPDPVDSGPLQDLFEGLVLLIGTPLERGSHATVREIHHAPRSGLRILDLEPARLR